MLGKKYVVGLATFGVGAFIYMVIRISRSFFSNVVNLTTSMYIEHNGLSTLYILSHVFMLLGLLFIGSSIWDGITSRRK